MDIRKLNRNMIELAVSQGIREMRRNPERGLRRLADMGRHFADKTYGGHVFMRIQKDLNMKDSLYFQMLRNCLEQVEDDALKTFGVNLGYNSWTCGVRQLRSLGLKNPEQADKIKWYCELRCQGKEENGAENMKKLSEIIRKKRQQGIYTFFLYMTSTFEEFPEFVFLLNRYTDCAFICFFKEDCFTEAQIKVLKRHHNCLYLLPIRGWKQAAREESSLVLTEQQRQTREMLREYKLLYSYYVVYEEMDSGITGLLDALEPVLELEPLILVLKASKNVNEDYRKSCYEEIWKQRDDPKYNTFLVELQEDCRRLNEMILGK